MIENTTYHCWIDGNYRQYSEWQQPKDYIELIVNNTRHCFKVRQFKTNPETTYYFCAEENDFPKVENFFNSFNRC